MRGEQSLDYIDIFLGEVFKMIMIKSMMILKQSLDYMNIFLDNVLIRILMKIWMKTIMKSTITMDHHDNQLKSRPVFLHCWGPVDHRRLVHTCQCDTTRGDGLSDHIIPVSILSYLITFFSYLIKFFSSHHHILGSHHTCQYLSD